MPAFDPTLGWRPRGTLVLSLGHRPQDGLRADILAPGIALHQIGDAMTPRTAEEAVYEGMIAGHSV